MSEPMDLTTELTDALNSAKTTSKAADKVKFLTQCEEILLHRDEKLLADNASYLTEFVSDTNADVRKFVASFIEKACKKTQAMMLSLFRPLLFLAQDKNMNVKKKSLLVLSNLYKPAISFIAKYEDSTAKGSKKVLKSYQGLAKDLNDIRILALSLLDSGEIPLIHASLKILQIIALCTLAPEIKQVVTSSRPVKPSVYDAFSLSDISRPHPVLFAASLEQEAIDIMNQVAKRINVPNPEEETKVTTKYFEKTCLTAAINTLTVVAIYRPSVRDIAIPCLLQLSLAVDMDNSVHKSYIQALKSNLLLLLKSPSMDLYQNDIIGSLTVVGAKAQADTALKKIQQIQQNLAVKNKRQRDDTENASNQAQKKLKRAEEYAKMVQPEAIPKALDSDELLQHQYPPTENTLANVTMLHSRPLEEIIDLVMKSMHYLPHAPPVLENGPKKSKKEEVRTLSAFQNHLDKVLDISKQTKAMLALQASSALIDGQPAVVAKNQPIELSPILALEQRQKAIKRIIEFCYGNGVMDKVNTIEESMSPSTIENALSNIILARLSCDVNVLNVTNKVIADIIDMKSSLLDMVVTNFEHTYDLALNILFNEYSNDFTMEEEEAPRYEAVFLILLQKIRPCKLLNHLITEAPVLTLRVFEQIFSTCENDESIMYGLDCLKEIVACRPADKQRSLASILYYSTHTTEKIREPAIRLTINKIFTSQPSQDNETIIAFARNMLNSLVDESKPELKLRQEMMRDANGVAPEVKEEPKPDVVMKSEDGQVEEVNEEAVMLQQQDIHRRFSLFLALCTKDTQLVKQLLDIYANASDQVKVELHDKLNELIQYLCKKCGNTNTLNLFSVFPKASGSLVLQFLTLIAQNVMNEEGSRAVELQTLIKATKALRYKEGGASPFKQDIRFKIPVLAGLSKDEVLNSLKSIYLLEESAVETAIVNIFDNPSPVITPDTLFCLLLNYEILVDFPLKNVIAATEICFKLKRKLFTQEVMATALQTLVEQDTLPVMLMRVILRMAKEYPKLKVFIVEILQKLIVRKIWQHPKLWSGFMLCLNMLQPHSYMILLRLPSEQLKQVLDKYDLKSKLVNVVKQADNLNLADDVLDLLKS